MLEGQLSRCDGTFGKVSLVQANGGRHSLKLAPELFHRVVQPLILHSVQDGDNYPIFRATSASGLSVSEPIHVLNRE